MIRLLAVLALLATTGAAHARPDTRDMYCDEAQDLVRRAGAITLSTGPNTYERFVFSQAQCLRMEIIRPFYAPTRDAGQCYVGYRCEPLNIRRNRD